MHCFCSPLQLDLPSARVRIPEDVTPAQQTQYVRLARLSASLTGAETVERLKLAIAPQCIGQLAGLLTVCEAGVHPAGRKGPEEQQHTDQSKRTEPRELCEQENRETHPLCLARECSSPVDLNMAKHTTQSE